MSYFGRKRNKAVNLELEALSFAARNAGMSYGLFMTRTTAAERQTLIREYEEMLRTKMLESSSQTVDPDLPQQ